jgi:hypothetical protein
MDEQLLLGNLEPSKYSPREYTKDDTRASTKLRGSTGDHVWLDTLLSIIILE